MPFIPDIYTDSPPSVTADEERMYVAYKVLGRGNIGLAKTGNPDVSGEWNNVILPEGGPPMQYILTTFNPAISACREGVVLIYKGQDDNRLWQLLLDGPSVIPRRSFPSVETDRAPAMNCPYIVYRNLQDDHLYVFRIESMPPQAHDLPMGLLIEDAATNRTPAIAQVTFGGNFVFIAFTDRHDGSIRYFSFPTEGAPGPGRGRIIETVPGIHSDHGPALAGLGGMLYLAYKFEESRQVGIASFNGRFWVDHGAVAGFETDVEPALAVFNNELYLFVCHPGDNRILYERLNMALLNRVLDIGFRPNPNGFSFVNFAEGSPNWETFRDTFGHSEIDEAAATAILMYILSGGMSSVPYIFWGFYGIYLSLLNGDLNTGMCTGYAALSLRRYMDDRHSTLFTDIPSVIAADELPAGIRRELTIAFGRLYGVPILEHLYEQCERGLGNISTVFRDVERDFISGSERDTGRIIFFVPNGGIDGIDMEFFNALPQTHAVTPYRIEYPAPGSGDPIRMYVYDCNNPGNGSVSNPGNSYFEFSDLDTDSPQFQFYTGDTTSNLDPNLQSSNGFTLASLTLREYLDADVDLPFSFLGEAILDIILSPVDLRIYNSRKKMTGCMNGKIYWQIPGSFPLYPSSNVFILPKKDYTREIVGKANGPYRFISLDPSGNNLMISSSAKGGTKPSVEKLKISSKKGIITLETTDKLKAFNFVFSKADKDEIRQVTLQNVYLKKDLPLTIKISNRLTNIKSSSYDFEKPISLQAVKFKKGDKAVKSIQTEKPISLDRVMNIKVNFGKKLAFKKR